MSAEEGPVAAATANQAENVKQQTATNDLSTEDLYGSLVITEEDIAGRDDDQPNQADAANGDKPLSKTQMKKLAKRQRIQEMKQQRKEQEKAAKAVAKAAKQAEREAQLAAMTPEERQARKQGARDSRRERTTQAAATKQKMQQAMAEGMKLVIDLEFDGKMTDAEISSLCQQLGYTYAAIKGAEKPCHLMLLGASGKLKAAIDKISGIHNWYCTYKEEPYIRQLADQKNQLVYLTADSSNEMTEVDPSKTYIIGGLVDRNRYKSICYDRARAQGIATAKLPIGQHMQLGTSQVITVNQVANIMTKYLETKDWPKTFAEVIPQRKVKADGSSDEPPAKRQHSEAQPAAEQSNAAEQAGE